MALDKNLLTLLCLIFPLLVPAQIESVFNDIRLNQSFQVVSEKLADIAESSNIVSIDQPSFPLASEKEEHLVCSQVNTGHGTINRVVFTFADDKLKYIEARGNAIEVLTYMLADTARTYLNYEVYAEEKLFLQKEEDAAWIMT